MTTLLRRVLQAFEEAEATIRLDALSRELGVAPGTLDSMIQHWVRKGRIREVPDVDLAKCGGCGVRSDCPFVMRLPRRYRLVRSAKASTEPKFAAVLCCKDEYSSYSH